MKIKLDTVHKAAGAKHISDERSTPKAIFVPQTSATKCEALSTSSSFGKTVCHLGCYARTNNNPLLTFSPPATPRPHCPLHYLCLPDDAAHRAPLQSFITYTRDESNDGELREVKLSTSSHNRSCTSSWLLLLFS